MQIEFKKQPHSQCKACVNKWKLIIDFKYKNYYYIDYIQVPVDLKLVIWTLTGS